MCFAAACLLALGAHGLPTTELDPPLQGTGPEHEWMPWHGSPQQHEFWKMPPRPRWETGQLVLQGFLGANLFETMETNGGSTDIDGSGESASQLPVIGGGGQWKLGGETVDFGLEAMFSFSGRANATAFAAGGGGAVIAVNVDMVLFEVYGGPVANLFLDDKTRIYLSAGPLMEWADFTQQNDSASIDQSGTGFGTGFYARTGIEFALPDRTMLGFGVRWADSRVDLDNDLGSLDLSGYQVVFTVTEGF